MNCIFNHCDRIKLKESDSRNQTVSSNARFLHNVPSKKSVYDTALNCVGIPFQLGHGGLDIDTDSFLHTRNTTERTKTKNQFYGRTFSNAYFGSGSIYPFTNEFEKKTNIYSPKSKSTMEYRSPIPNLFYYHYDNVQKISPLITGIHQYADTRNELRKTTNRNTL